MRLSSRLCTALLAVFIIIDATILATTGNDTGPRATHTASPGAAHVVVARPARPVPEVAQGAATVATPARRDEQPQGDGIALPTPSFPSLPALPPALRADATPPEPTPPATGRPTAQRPGARAVKPAGKAVAGRSGRPPVKPAVRRSRRSRLPVAHARHLAPVRIPPRRTPGPTSYSHYLRSLTGTDADLWRMYRLGQGDAARHAAGARHVVLLDVGGQVPGGVHLSTTRRFLSYWRLDRAVDAYVLGYHSRQKANAPVTIAIGTNNDLLTSLGTGKQWAWHVVNPVYRYARRFPNITIAGAADLEPGFAASVWGSRAWVVGFLHATWLPLIFNGSADGCSWTHASSRCNHGWTARDLAYVAGAWTPRITVLPQIYNLHMVDQWVQIAMTAIRDGGHRLRFWGPLTENGACGREPNCPTMPGVAAWLALWRGLHRYGVLAPAELPARTDLDVR